MFYFKFPQRGNGSELYKDRPILDKTNYPKKVMKIMHRLMDIMARSIEVSLMSRTVKQALEIKWKYWGSEQAAG